MTFKFFILFPHFPTDVFRIFSGIPDISNLYFYSLSGLLGLCFIIYSPLYHFLLHCSFVFVFTCIVFCTSISFLLLALVYGVILFSHFLMWEFRLLRLLFSNVSISCYNFPLQHSFSWTTQFFIFLIITFSQFRVFLKFLFTPYYTHELFKNLSLISMCLEIFLLYSDNNI